MLSSAMSRLLPTTTRTSDGRVGDSALGVAALGLPPLRCRGLPGSAAPCCELASSAPRATQPAMPLPAQAALSSQLVGYKGSVQLFKRNAP